MQPDEPFDCVVRVLQEGYDGERASNWTRERGRSPPLASLGQDPQSVVVVVPASKRLLARASEFFSAALSAPWCKGADITTLNITVESSYEAQSVFSLLDYCIDTNSLPTGELGAGGNLPLESCKWMDKSKSWIGCRLRGAARTFPDRTAVWRGGVHGGMRPAFGRRGARHAFRWHVVVLNVF
jgi:hypothetical protein